MESDHAFTGGVELEVVCPDCHGTGGVRESDGGKLSCYSCSGAGYIATGFGEKLLALMEHHLPRLLRAIDRE
jgi:hypothetical protein